MPLGPVNLGGVLGRAREVASFPELMPPPPPPPDVWILGLDLGQSRDFTAAVALKRREAWEGGEPRREYDCPFIHRWPLGTAYPQIVSDLCRIVADLPRPQLVVDATGCGRPVVDLIVKARPAVGKLVPAVITGGASAHFAGGYWTVPKRDLCGAAAVVVEGRRLHVARELPEAEILMNELRAFTAKISTSGREEFENDWRVAPHDDVLLALSLAVWWDTRGGRTLRVGGLTPPAGAAPPLPPRGLARWGW